jgi:ABC-type nitrate/sulfonate/bicarbonate transport system substrate-binding protein
MHRNIRTTVAALLAPLALLGSGCAAQPVSPSPAQPGAEVTSPDDIDLTGERIRFIVSPPDVLATNLEYLLDTLEGWGAEVERVEVLSTTGLQGVLANQVDFATNGADEMVLGTANGTGITAIASHRAKMDYVMAGSEDITSVADLEGKTVGVSGPAGFDALLTRLLLDKYGVDADTVKFVQIGNSGDRAAALIGGRVDAVTIFLSTWLGIEGQAVNEVSNLADELGDFPKEAIFGLPAYIDSHPNVALAVACANLEANRWFADERDEWIAKALDFVPDSTDDEVSSLYDLVAGIGMYPTDADELLVPSGLQDLADAMLDNGDIQEPTDMSDVIDHSHLDQAAKIGCGAE